MTASGRFPTNHLLYFFLFLNTSKIPIATPIQPIKNPSLKIELAVLLSNTDKIDNPADTKDNKKPMENIFIPK